MKKNLKKILTTSVLSGLVFGLAAINNSYAAYELSSEVKTATPALIQASSIGTLSYENPQLANLPNKDAILVMSFGTTYPETRSKTIEATVNAIKAEHPGVKVVTAFTSHIIIDRVKANEGITYPTPEEALKELKKEGYTRISLVSLDIIPGMEYNYKKAVYNEYKHEFKKMTLATPLMYWMGQEEQDDDIVKFLEALKTQFPKQGPTDAILVMAHGTPDPSNAYYAVIQDRIESLGLKNVYVYTVEGWPRLDDITPVLKSKGITHVTLMPMMMVAGDHANNDMAGDEPDSHKSILEAEGFKVDAYLHGLGENKNIRQIFADHANEAWNALESNK